MGQTGVVADHSKMELKETEVCDKTVKMEEWNGLFREAPSFYRCVQQKLGHMECHRI